MSIGRNKYVFGVGGLCAIVIVAILFLVFNFDKGNREIIKVYEKNEINNKQYGVYIEKEDGSGYELLEEENIFPDSSKYSFNVTESYCIDNKDNIVSNAISYSDGKVTVTSNKTIYCYLYFDEIKDDVTITVSTDGVSNTISTSGIYKQSVTCSSGNAYYNPYYQRLEIGEIKRGTKCILDYTKDTTSYDKLSSIVQEKATTNANGYRYSGENPNNYVWFNNELWRIIGLVPACTSASNGTCSARTNLVKIVRDTSIGGIMYDATNNRTGLWGANTLYKLLNEYYYGKLDGTGAYCASWGSTSLIGSCDYSRIGISKRENDYYGKMVEDVYWNIGTSTYSATPGTVYGTESAKVTTNPSKIGLMSASDYGYAAIVNGYGTSLSSYNASTIVKTNWLWGKGRLLTNIQDSSYSFYVLQLNYDGSVIGSGTTGSAVCPALYLNDGVYKLSGDGTLLNPYMIGM